MTKKQFLSIFIIIFLFLFSFLFYCNAHTPLIGDDWSYLWDFSSDNSKPLLGPSLDANRIANIFQIFPSMAAHRNYMNGRLAPHFFVQVFLMLPKSVFNIVNSIVFIAQVLIILRCGILFFNSKKEYFSIIVFFLSIFGSLWIFEPNFGQINFWLDGAINYCWAAVVSMLFILYYINWLLKTDSNEVVSKRRKIFNNILFIIVSFFTGYWCECSAIACIVFALLINLCAKLYKSAKIPSVNYISFAFCVLGFVLMISSGAEKVKANFSFSLYSITYRLIEIFDILRQFWLLWVVVIVLIVFAYVSSKDKNLVIVSSVLLVAALASSFCLIAAWYVTSRCFFFTVVLLVTDIVVLSCGLFKDYKKFILSLCFVCITALPYYATVGFLDIGTSSTQYEANSQYLENCSKNGIKDAYLPYVVPSTKYCAQFGQNYIDERPDYIPNIYIAKYYGLDSVNIK